MTGAYYICTQLAFTVDIRMVLSVGLTRMHVIRSLTSPANVFVASGCNNSCTVHQMCAPAGDFCFDIYSRIFSITVTVTEQTHGRGVIPFAPCQLVAQYCISTQLWLMFSYCIPILLIVGPIIYIVSIIVLLHGQGVFLCARLSITLICTNEETSRTPVIPNFFKSTYRGSGMLNFSKSKPLTQRRPNICSVSSFYLVKFHCSRADECLYTSENEESLGTTFMMFYTILLHRSRGACWYT